VFFVPFAVQILPLPDFLDFQIQSDRILT